MQFKDKVITIVKCVPKGKVVSYGQVALVAGIPRAARQVGYILSRIDDPINIPWWRVVNNKGYISIKSPEFAASEQKRLLQEEGIPVSDNFEIDIEKYRFLEFEIYDDLEYTLPNEA